MLQRDHAALVLIDIQGKMAERMHDKETLYRNLQILVQGARALDLPVLWLEQYPRGLGPTIPEIAELLSDQRPLAKTCFSACGLDAFQTALRATGRRQILLAGIESHICVWQTARDLLNTGHHVEIVSDAVSSRTAANKPIHFLVKFYRVVQWYSAMKEWHPAPLYGHPLSLVAPTRGGRPAAPAAAPRSAPPSRTPRPRTLSGTPPRTAHGKTRR